MCPLCIFFTCVLQQTYWITRTEGATVIKCNHTELIRYIVKKLNTGILYKVPGYQSRWSTMNFYFYLLSDLNYCFPEVLSFNSMAVITHLRMNNIFHHKHLLKNCSIHNLQKQILKFKWFSYPLSAPFVSGWHHFIVYLQGCKYSFRNYFCRQIIGIERLHDKQTCYALYDNSSFLTKANKF